MENGINSKEIIITSLYSYPIKSCHENKLEWSIVKETGLLNDRKLSIVLKDSLAFVTIREIPLIYEIRTSFDQNNPDICSISIPGSEKAFTVDIGLKTQEIEESKILNVSLWDLPCKVYPVETENDELNKELSRYLAKEVILIKPFTHRDYKSKNSNKFSGMQKETDSFFFADDAPILITSEESFDYINNLVMKSGDVSLQPICFRPNIILKGGEEPFWEGKVNKLQVGDVILRRVKPCTRCKVTTFDFDSKQFRKSKQPLEIMAEETWDDLMEGVVFGHYFVADVSENSDSKLKVGDLVNILS